jgi:hypothetical protein
VQLVNQGRFLGENLGCSDLCYPARMNWVVRSYSSTETWTECWSETSMDVTVGDYVGYQDNLLNSK